ncbi:WbqC family protein [Methylophaga sp.]|uniref:WbqC family protein n=1 Tax=Methylophaga sp. TaxID=2024840 RepID=UPI00271A4F9E|nr:WbqC family protein [Methylophaga sp.]MDO8828428.1 WbqC family protein [Methylophaga sp.]
MKLAIMQPYFFPYIGYFQLISAADTFVVYDDVNFIKGGWINRNFILSNGDKLRITLQLLGASPNQLINQIHVGNSGHKLFKTIQQSYSRANYYDDVIPLIEKILYSEETNLAAFLNFSLRQICDYLGLDRKWYLSSDLNKDNALRGQQKVLAICEELGAKQYINVPGGRALYDHGSFAEQEIQLSFLEPVIQSYEQNSHVFIPNLSIIDVMMFNSQKQCQQMVREYGIV